jgi:hypothetical protein
MQDANVVDAFVAIVALQSVRRFLCRGQLLHFLAVRSMPLLQRLLSKMSGDAETSCGRNATC